MRKTVSGRLVCRSRKKAAWRDAVGCLFLSLLQLVGVEFQLCPFKNVSISTAALSWSGRKACHKLSRFELVHEEVGHDWLLRLALGALLLNCSADLGSLVFPKRNAVVLQIVLLERRGINLDDAVLHKSLRTDQLVV